MLENYHCASVFALLKEREELNIFRQVDSAVYRKMRKLIIETVLATDMSLHFVLLNKLKARLEGEINTKNEDDLVV